MYSIEKILKELRTEFPEASDREIVKMAMRISIPAFALTCLPKSVPLTMPEVHFEIYDLLQDKEAKKLAIALPRGMAKSTIASFIYILWEILNKPPDRDLFAVLISESRSQSINYLTRIKNTLDHNKKIKRYFGNLGSDTAERWREDDIILANGARVLALGTGQKVRGLIKDDTRSNIIVLDDFESEMNANTAEARAFNRKWITEAVIPSLSQQDGRIIAIGTIISEDCFLQWVKDAPDWKVIWKSIIDENGNSIWEEMYPMEKIEEIRQGFEHMGNTSGFFQEYMNQPQSPDDAPFRPEYIHTYDGKIEEINGEWYVNYNGEKRLVYLFLGIDLASAISAHSDYTVMTTIGIDADGYQFIVDMVRVKCNPAEHPKMIIDLFKKWHHRGVYIESQAYQESCRMTTRQMMLEEGIYIPGIEKKITHRTSKSQRLIGLVPLMAQGKLIFRPNDLEAEREFLAFPRGKHDDILDSIWMASNYGYRPPKKRLQTSPDKEMVRKERLSWMAV
jgi:predicted phage terminase large subunit-like protein